MVNSTRSRFDRELLQLREDLLHLGAIARGAVARAMQALVEGDLDLASEVIAADASVNKLRYDIESQCYALLAMEQPVAGDMRLIASVLTMSSDLERIGDHGKK